MTYVARTTEEMQKLETIVKRAINFDPERGDEVEVANIAFASNRIDTTPKETGWLSKLKGFSSLGRYLFLAMVVLMVFLFVIRPIMKWLTTVPTGEVEILQQLPKTVGELESVYGGRGSHYREQAARLLTSDSERSVALMRDWMKEKRA